MQRQNKRGISETYFRGEHISIETLKMVKSLSCKHIILKDIPLYPKADKAEFHVDKVCHVTSPTGLAGIMNLSGFTAGQRGNFTWWALHITEGEIEAAENHLLEKLFRYSFDPTMGEEKIHKPFLSEFTTSPVFQKGSRYGNFKFTFPLEDLMQMYTEQICEGKKPVLRVYETVVYKQEIMYAVVVHSPEVKEFDEYPVLDDRDDQAICIYKDGKIVWRAEAICETHTKKLIINRESETVETEELGWGYEFFMWDHVTLAFHLPVGHTLVVEEGVLKDRLNACEGIKPFLQKEMLTLEKAEEVVNAIKNGIASDSAI